MNLSFYQSAWQANAALPKQVLHSTCLQRPVTRGILNIWVHRVSPSMLVGFQELNIGKSYEYFQKISSDSCRDF